MILDKDLIFSNDQALTATGVSENIIDQGAAGDALGNEMYLVVKTGDTAFTTGDSLIITLESDSDVGMATAKITPYISSTILTAALTANKILVKVKLPPGLKRYLRLAYTVGGSNFATAKLTAFLTPNVDNI